MRSPVAELGGALRRLVNQTLVNQTPIPYTGRPSLTLPFNQRNNAEAQMQAMGAVGTLFAIVNRTSVSTSAVNWRLWRKATSGKEEDRVEVTTHAALAVWSKPNDFYTRQELVESEQQHIDLTGEGYLVIARHSAMRGVPFELWPARPDRMTPVPDRDNFLVGWIYNGPDGEKIPLPREDVIQIRMPNPLDPHRGMGPVQALLADLDSIRYSAEWNRNFFLNSAEPGGIIEVDRRLSDDEFDEMTRRWREQHQGVSQAHRVAVLEQGKWVDRKFSMRDMQFAELRQVSRDVVREAFGMPKFAIGDVDDVNRATAEASKAWFAEHLTVPRLDRFKWALNNDFFPQFGPTATGLEFDYDNPVPANSAANNAERDSKSTAAVALVGAGWDPDDVLIAVDLPQMRFEKPAPPPAPPASLPGGGVALDRLVDTLFTNRNNLALTGGARRPAIHAAAPLPGTPAHLSPADLPDVSGMLTALDNALADLLAQWPDITAAQKQQLVTQAEQIAAHGQLSDLATMHVDTTQARDALLAAMIVLAALASGQLVAEAAAQGIEIVAGIVARTELEQVSALVAQLLADELKVSASRAAMQANGPGATAEMVAAAVRDHLDSLSGANANRQLGGALHGSMNAARAATLRAAPEGAIYAQEMNDSNTCLPCRQISGVWLANTSDIAPALLSYPAGAFGGYIACKGGVNCRGTIVGVWRPEQTGDTT